MRRPRTSRPAPVAVQAPAPLGLEDWLIRHGRWIVLALVLAASARIVATYRVYNHTADEPAHIACGLEWLDRGTYRLEPQHPPLARVAAAIGPRLLGIRSEARGESGSDAMFHEGTRILYAGGHYDRTLAWARAGILPFFWLACFVVYEWGRRYYGPAVALFSVLIFSLLPPVLAHAGLATTDMALTACTGAAFLAGAVWLETPSRAGGAWFGAALGLAALSKFSAIAFLPAAAAFSLAAARPGFGRLAAEVRRRLPTLGLAAAIALSVVWAGYRFSTGSAFVEGLRAVMEHNRQGHHSYLLGQVSDTGFLAFFPVALAVKTPLPVLLLFAIGAILTAKRRQWTALAFSLAILAVGMASRIDIGIRHILPIYFGISLLSGVALAWLIEQGRQRRWLLAIPAILLLFLAVPTVAAHPDYLPYFNVLAGNEPEKILVDSDLDWGQDMKRLARRLHELGAKSVTYKTILVADFEREHGIPPMTKEMSVLAPNPGWNAISVTVWKEIRFGLFGKYAQLTLWPDRYKPVERVGKSILLWYFPPGS